MTSVPQPSASVPGSKPGQGGAGQLSVWWYVNLLLKRRRLFIALPLMTGLFAGVLSLLNPRQYMANASFIPQEPRAIQTGLSAIASQFGIGASAGASSPQFYADLLQTRGVMQQVVQTHYTIPGPSAFDGNLIRYFRIRPDSGEKALGLAIKALQKSVSVSPDRITGVVKFSVTTTNPGLSARVARRLLEMLNDYNLRRRQSQAHAEREFVEQRLAIAQDSLATAEEAVASFLRRNRAFANSPELKAEDDRLERQVQLRQQLYLSLAQSRETAALEEVRNTPVVTVIEQPEGYVEPVRRGTIDRAILGVLLGAVLAAAYVFGGAYLAGRPVDQSVEYRESMLQWHELLAGLRALVRRRAQ